MTRLQPFFSYYGGKHRAAAIYPPPRHGIVVEPFAGSAGYATRWFERQVVLADLDPRIAGIWTYLIAVKESDVLALPLKFDHVDAIDVPQEAKWLLGFWIAKGSAYPRATPSPWQHRDAYYPLSTWSEQTRARIARQVHRIRHWTIRHCSYDALDDVRATWFIDAPYEGRLGRHYAFRDLDRAALAAWCRTRRGLTIVCEAQGATWLPFFPMANVASMATRHGRRYSAEAAWIGDDEQLAATHGLAQGALF